MNEKVYILQLNNLTIDELSGIMYLLDGLDIQPNGVVHEIDGDITKSFQIMNGIIHNVVLEQEVDDGSE